MYLTRDILLTLGYFDAFSYPLRKRELFIFLPHKYPADEFENTLQMLVNDSLVYQLGEFYSLQNYYDIVKRRMKGNEMAKELLHVADKVASFISRFPFVRGVAISGSLSKNFADERSDIDLFIICSRNRLWIARTLLHCFKKLTFLFNKQHYFCMNYFIDEQELEIAEKNVYTATEITTLMPLYGCVFEDFFSANNWTKDFLPNNYLRISSSKLLKISFYKRAAEVFFNVFAANHLDNLLMRITSSRWAKKYSKRKLNQRGIVMSMSASKHVAKPDPKEFQQKLVAIYLAKAVEFEMMLQDKVLINPIH